MKPFVALLAITLTLVSGQRRPSTGYGVPAQAEYGQPTASASSLAEARHGHEGLDWLIESVPGTPDTDYPIHSQEDLQSLRFDCNGQVEGGYYADSDTRCQAFHVCVPDGLGGLATQSFLCPNGTIFNQEYFICDWWFNFDCSQAQSLYTRNDEVAAEREAASQASAQRGSASNIRNTYSAEPAQPSYSRQG